MWLINSQTRLSPVRSLDSLVQSQKRQNDLCLQGKPFNITIIQVYAPTSNTEETEIEWFYEDLQDLLELTPQKSLIVTHIE